MIQYLLDTDSFIFLLKGNTNIQARARTVGYAALALSAITVAEVLHGAYYSARPAQTLSECSSLLSQFTVIVVDAAVADLFGRMKADLRRAGHLIADFDLLIGATVITSARTLVTNNLRHFQRLQPHGILIENWIV